MLSPKRRTRESQVFHGKLDSPAINGGTWSREENQSAFREMDVTRSGVVSREDFVEYHLQVLGHIANDDEAFENVIRHITASLEVRAHHLGILDFVAL